MSEKSMYPPISFFYSWENISESLYPSVMREFRDNGAKHLVINDFLLGRIIHDPHCLPRLRKFQHDAGINFFEVHGLWSTGYDLVCTDRSRRPGLIADHKLAMNYAAEMGCRTYVIHIGAYESVFFRTPNSELRPNGIAVLEQLLPEAEKLNLVIAVENSYEISNTPDEVLYYIRHFDNPHIGCCFDSGHANIMEPAPGKTQDRYCDDLKEAWENHVVQYRDAFKKLSPYIVTVHLHDNNGFQDQHSLPFTGTVDWGKLASGLASLPRLQSIQSEVRTGTTAEWSIRRLCETFASIFREEK